MAAFVLAWPGAIAIGEYAGNADERRRDEQRPADDILLGHRRDVGTREEADGQQQESKKSHLSRSPLP